MATTPQQPQRTGVNPTPPQQPQRTGVNPTPPQQPRHPEHDVEDKPDPEPVVPVGEQQLEASQAMEKEGIAKWIAEHDERKPADRGKAVEGSTPKAH